MPPLLKIVASKKITAVVTIEDATAKQIDQYAAMTKGSADDVVQAALDYVFSTDKEFAKFRDEHASAKPTIPLRLKKPASAAAKPEEASSSTKNSTAAAR